MTDTRKITASFTFHGQRIENVDVINPGGWFGKTWILGIGGSYTLLFFVVEADSASDAIDELADSETYGHHIRIDESSLADYGYEANPGDIIGGVDVTEKGWMRLDGVFITDPEECKYLREPYSGGNFGTPCDLDWLDVLTEGDSCDVLYHVEGITDPVNPPDLDATLERAEKRAEWEESVSGQGKFEGECAYLAYFYDRYLEGFADDDENDVLRFDVTDEDTAIFPELIGRESVYLYERSDGFVCEVDGFGESEDTDEDDASEDE